ncbi:MAG: Thiol-disulfide oxidoreductase ResA [Myxococcota bacterium]|nr:Thiol-disulfide oxidoreductase ResA [Myxococcota bacterium]
MERIRAPELNTALAWLNVDRPLTLRELRGNLVILDFWTYCCINCMHVLPVLREMEEKFAGDPVVVIGVHSGKFDAERDPARIREAIGRHGIAHPVAVDDDMDIWSRYGVRSWPTLVIIRPDGSLAAVAPGEPDPRILEEFIRGELARARAAGTLNSGPPALPCTPAASERTLNYPGKVSAAPNGGLVISDSGHHRVLICSRDGTVEHAVGGGLRGWKDGPAAEACFDDPQGTCWWNGALFIADTRNHLLRKFDPAAGVVSTVAGTGELGREIVRGRGHALSTPLRSPWDLCAVDDVIYVAMAGSHQIWRFWPAAGEIEVYAGTGAESLADGPVAKSAWAQPSGLSHRNGKLYVADSETSAVRVIDLDRDEVSTLVGTGLFDFGDADGGAMTTRLQHALGVAAIEGGVLVADTYNGKIRFLREGVVRSETRLAGLHEPASIQIEADGSWIIADTNAHQVVRVRHGLMEEVVITGAPVPRNGAWNSRSGGAAPPAGTVSWFSQLLRLGESEGLAPGGGDILLRLQAPEGKKFAAGSPLHVDLEVSRRPDLFSTAEESIHLICEGGPLQTLPISCQVADLPADRVESELVARISLVLCDSGDSSLCEPARLHLRIPVRLLRHGGGHRLEWELPVK